MPEELGNSLDFCWHGRDDQRKSSAIDTQYLTGAVVPYEPNVE